VASSPTVRTRVWPAARPPGSVQVWARQPPVACRAESQILTDWPSASAYVASESVGRSFGRAAAVLACAAVFRRAEVTARGLLELTPGPGPRPSNSTGPSADLGRSGQVRRFRSESFCVRTITCGPSAERPTRPKFDGRSRPTAGRPGRVHGPGLRAPLLVPPATAVSSPRLTGRQYPGVNPRKAHRPSVPRVSSPWLTSQQRSQFPAAHGQSVPRGSRAVSSRWLTGRQFPRSITAGPLAGYFRVGAPCEGPAVPRRDPRPGALVRCAASGRRTTRTAADSAGLRPGVRPGCRSRAQRDAPLRKEPRLIRSRPRPAPPPLGATCTGHRVGLGAGGAGWGE